MDETGKKQKRIRLVLLLGLILLGALVRMLQIGQFPPGLNQDEASEGYEAWALLTSGMDRNGDAWPVLFTSWGSGQNVLYAWLSMPLLAVFGLSPAVLRLTSAVLGTATIPVMYLLGRKLSGPAAGWGAAVLTALCPWHIMLSRWALEANILPFFLLAGILSGVLAMEKPWALCGAAAMFALSLYAYGTAFVFLGAFLPPALLYLALKGRLPWKVWLVSVLVFAVIALPVCLANLRNMLGLEEMRLLGMTLPRLNETRQSSTTAFGSGANAYWENAKAFLKILREQSDGYLYNSLPGEMFAPGTLLFAAVGFADTLVRVFRKRLRKGEVLLLCAVFAVLVSAFVIEPNLNRMNMAFLPVLYYAAIGFGALWALPIRKAGRGILSGICCLVVLLGFFGAANRYVTLARETLSVWFFEGVGEAIVYADSLETETVWVTNTVNMPYIYVLFYTRTPPEAFLDTVEYRNPGAAFQWVDSFGKWRFDSEPAADGGDVCVLYDWEAENMEILRRFGDFVVCRK